MKEIDLSKIFIQTEIKDFDSKLRKIKHKSLIKKLKFWRTIK